MIVSPRNDAARQPSWLPLNAPPACGGKGCVAICVCFNTSDVYSSRVDADQEHAVAPLLNDGADGVDDETRSVATELDDELINDPGASMPSRGAVSIWDTLDKIGDYDSDAGGDADEHTPVPLSAPLIPPRKRHLSPSTMLPLRKRPLLSCFGDIVCCVAAR
mmetsp:Transcript_20242/g.52245  ORF Transcript_20242/g.52245 Transcript_20242/m.52245 type:complete len:162 (-) Transcript_20242:113-598(-)